jgi:TRAP-type mannitol/chloroaromatic compound transport system permease large subunit
VTLAVFTFSLLGAMALGMPIAFALIVCGVALMHSLDVFDSQIVAQNIINGADSFPLMAVPFFMLAGELMNRGGLARRIVNVALALVGHVKGGLGYVTILAACVLSSLSGSAAATLPRWPPACAHDGRCRPSQDERGRTCRRQRRHRAGDSAEHRLRAVRRYRRRVDLKTVPGRHLSRPHARRGTLLCLVVGRAWRTTASPPRKSLREIVWAFIDGFWALMLPAIIVVGLRFGVFTPTEAAVVVAVYALFVSTCVYRELKIGDLYDVFVSAALSTSVVMFLVAAALVSPG